MPVTLYFTIFLCPQISGLRLSRQNTFRIDTMALTNTLFTSALFLLYSGNAFAFPNPAIMAREDLRPMFTPPAGTPGLVGTNFTGISPTGTGYIGTSTSIHPTTTPLIERRQVHTPSGGIINSGGQNSTALGPTSTGTGMVGPTGLAQEQSAP